MPVEPDAYRVLQVLPDADGDVIRAAYRALARRYHPDGTAPDGLRMAELNAAYERVGRPDRRESYDAERGAPVAVGPGRPESTAPTWVDGPLARRQRQVSGEPREVIDFGRYAGWRIADLARHDPEYLRWLSRHSTGYRFREAIARSLPSEGELGRRASVLG
ncbi:MAG TPA: DnaJ domain-containing protein [Candidatus Limnocylindrales bacterium]|nr:DnaJ domain-containing protein [Candidatus Limnocylindrales bacterium]